MKNLVLATTMWGVVSGDVAQDRDRQLRDEVWAEFLRGGSTPIRFELNSTSAWKIVDCIPLDNSTQTEMEREMAGGKNVGDTKAFKAANTSSWNWASFKKRFMR